MPGTHRSGGKNRKPTEMKVLEGTFRGDRHGNEPVVETKWPEAPAHLSERERELWEQLKPLCQSWVAPSDWLTIHGVVSLADRILRIQEAQRATDDSGNPIAFKYTTDGDGNANAEPKENPLYGMELKTWRELRAFIGLLGLSPVDRTRMPSSDAGKPANPLDKFIKRA